MRARGRRLHERQGWWVVRSLLLAAVIGALASCTLLVDEDAAQCGIDADCAARGPDFSGTICSTQGLCVPAPAPAPECTKNSECAAKGPDLVCNAQAEKCVPLKSDDCRIEFGDPTVDGAVFFGLMSEVKPDDSLYFRETQHAMAAKLAFQEFFDRSGARFPGDRGAVLVVCGESAPRRAAAHLANLGVKAVIGPSNEGRQKAVVETLVPARIPSFSPWITGNPARVVTGSTGLAWLTSFERSDVVAPLNGLLAEQETRLKTARSLENIRVAVIVGDGGTSSFNPYAQYGDLMDQRLFFNGKSAVENGRDSTCGNCYRRFGTSEAPPDVVAQRANDILAFAPHFIIPLADLDFGAQLLPELETQYATLPESSRPIYLHPFLQVEEPGYKSLALSVGETRRRITGIRPLRDNGFELFQDKFKEAFRPPSNPEGLGPEPNVGAGRSFEAALLVLFSTYAALVENGAATPADVALALERVTDTTIAERVTLLDISRGISRVNARERINLDGLFSAFDFDPATNTSRATWTTWCLGQQGQLLSGTRLFDNGTFGPPAFCE